MIIESRINSEFAGSSFLKNLPVMIEYNRAIYEYAITEALGNEEAQMKAFGAFAYGLKHEPQTMLFGKEATFADFPGLKHDIENGQAQFLRWLNHPLGITPLTEPTKGFIIDRNLYHLGLSVKKIYGDLKRHHLEVMEREFTKLQFNKPTAWLSRIYNGTQVAMFEQWVADTFITGRSN